MQPRCLRWTCAAALLSVLVATAAGAEEDFDQWLAEALFAVPASARDTSNQIETPAIATNSTTLVDTSSASDLVGIALNLKDLGGSTASVAPTDVTSAAATVSLYALWAAGAGFNPLAPVRYCDTWSRRTRMVSTTLGFNANDGDAILAGFKVEIPFLSQRDPCNAEEFRQVREVVQLAATNKKVAADFATKSRAIREALFEAARAANTPDGDRSLDDQRVLDSASGSFADFSNALTNGDIAIQRLLALVDSQPVYDLIEADAEDSPFQKLDRQLKEAVASFRAQPRFALEFLTNQRSGSEDDYQVIGIVDLGLRPGLKFVANGGWQKRRTNGGTDASNGGSLAVAFQLDTNPGSLTGRRGIRIALEAEALWLADAPDRYQGQLGVVVPLFAGLEIPLTMTVANRSVDRSDVEFRGNVGFALDTALLAQLLMNR